MKKWNLWDKLYDSYYHVGCGIRYSIYRSLFYVIMKREPKKFS